MDTSLEDADRLLEEAFDAGYADARHIVDLAFIKAARGEVSAGLEIVKLLHPVGEHTSWTQVAEVISNKELGSDLVAQGFALGINKSSIWNILGTYAKRFLDDLSLAISMYRTALKLNPSNAVAMTNLSRALLEQGTLEHAREAQRWISKAASCADRRFRWWRSVREEVTRTLEGLGLDQSRNGPKIPTRVRRLADLQNTFHALKIWDNTQERGYEFQKLIARLIDFSLGNCQPSYRAKMTWADNSIIQVDAAFCFLDTQYFRVETKWTSTATEPNDIVLFREKLDVAGLKGLFVSVKGFTREAIAKAFSYRHEREILLMDGQELEYVLNGSPSFDEAIRRKQLYFAIESNPYYRIFPAVQEEVD